MTDRQRQTDRQTEMREREGGGEEREMTETHRETQRDDRERYTETER